MSDTFASQQSKPRIRNLERKRERAELELGRAMAAAAAAKERSSKGIY